MDDFSVAVEMCTRALEVDGTAVKALYIRSLAHHGSQQLSAALEEIKAAIKLAPGDVNFQAQYVKVLKDKQKEIEDAALQMQVLFTQNTE